MILISLQDTYTNDLIHIGVQQMTMLQTECCYTLQRHRSNVLFGLFRVLQVSREGKCTHSDVPRQLIYGTMVYVRQTIVADASLALSRAVTIATRYSCVRRQFGSQNGGPETQVIRVPVF